MYGGTEQHYGVEIYIYCIVDDIRGDVSQYIYLCTVDYIGTYVRVLFSHYILLLAELMAFLSIVTL